MGQVKAFQSEVQRDKVHFPKIQETIRKFGYPAVADMAGLKSYQTVWKYYHQKPILPQSERKILEGLKKLMKGDGLAKELAKDIINIKTKEQENVL